MGSFLDIVGGTFIGGMILLIVLSSTESSTRDFLNYNADAIVQNQMAHMVTIIESDIRKIGFGITEDQKSTIIQTGQSDRLKFLAHLNMTIDMAPDTIEYIVTVGDTIDYGFRTIYMYKITRKVTIVGQAPDKVMIGKIGNSEVFKYLDQIGRPVANPKTARAVEVTLIAFDPQIVLSPGLTSKRLDNYQTIQEKNEELNRLIRPSFWRQTRLVSKNLKR